MSKLTRFLLAWGASFGGAQPALALDPLKPPGQNFNLRNWKLTLPDATATEISASQLNGGYTSTYFYTGPDGAMTFWAPVTGGTTANSSYPRSELRELISPQNSSSNWLGFGTHILRGQCKVLQAPSTQKLIVGQVHGYNVQLLVKLQWEDGQLEASVKNNPVGGGSTRYPLGSAALGSLITYEIKVVDGVVSVTANGRSMSHDFFATDPAWRSVTYYFKAGNYLQDNAGLPVEGGIVAFYDLFVSHVFASAPPTPPVVTVQPVSQTVQSNGTVTLSTTVAGSGPMSYQWRTNKVPITGERTNTLTISNFRTAQQLNYDVVVTNAAGKATSATARLHLNAPLRFVSNGLDANKRLVCTLAGVANTNYVIEGTTNFATWTRLATNKSATGLLTYTNTRSGSRWFLRARKA